jgi:putative MATE family efflux protein
VNLLKKDRDFYRQILAITIPIVIQNGISSFVSLLDNIMVGQMGTIPMSGVSIANQLFSIYALCIFGASAGAGIFTAQFYGKNDMEGVRYTFRFKYMVCTLLALLGLVVFMLWDAPLLSMYLTGEGDPADAALTLAEARDYVRVNLWGFIPFALANAYSSTLRETGKTTVPMVGGIAAVLVNLVLNYLLIFGNFGLPEMGVKGAALATVVSRFVELSIVAGWAHWNSGKITTYIRGAYQSLRIPASLLKSIITKFIPLLANEFMWSAGIAMLNQCYSTCGLDVVPALNISATIQNLANVVSIALANAVGICMGQMLGAGKSREELLSSNRKLMRLSLLVGAVFGCVLLAISGLFPRLYNTNEDVRSLAMALICVTGLLMPLMSYTLSSYFTLRSGGQVIVTFLFDSCFMWCCPVLLAFCLSRFTSMHIVLMYGICQGMDLIKAGIGTVLIRKGIWIRNLTQ